MFQYQRRVISECDNWKGISLLAPCAPRILRGDDCCAMYPGRGSGHCGNVSYTLQSVFQPDSGFMAENM